MFSDLATALLHIKWVYIKIFKTESTVYCKLLPTIWRIQKSCNLSKRSCIQTFTVFQKRSEQKTQIKIKRISWPLKTEQTCTKKSVCLIHTVLKAWVCGKLIIKKNSARQLCKVIVDENLITQFLCFLSAMFNLIPFPLWNFKFKVVGLENMSFGQKKKY